LFTVVVALTIVAVSPSRRPPPHGHRPSTRVHRRALAGLGRHPKPLSGGVYVTVPVTVLWMFALFVVESNAC
jgi:hypothetical protein